MGKRKQNDETGMLNDSEDENFRLSSLESPLNMSVKRLKSLTIASPGEPQFNNYEFLRDLAARKSSAQLSAGVIGDQAPRDVLLDMILPTLEQAQLVKLVQQLMSQHPQLRPDVTALIPQLSLGSAKLILEKAEKKVYSAFPYTRGGPDTSDYSFNRVRAAIQHLQDDILSFLDYFTLSSHYSGEREHEFPANAFVYLQYCTEIVHRLPNWSNPQHNIETKHPLYSQLGHQWVSVTSELCRMVKSGGRMFGADALRQWYSELNGHVLFLNHQFQAFDEALLLFKQDLGWLVGIRPSPSRA